MTAYQTDVFGYYIGVVECQKDPLVADRYAIPAGATTIKPPEQELHKIARFDGNVWFLEPNYSGITYYSKQDKSEKTYDKGELPDFTLYTDIRPTSDLPYVVFDNTKNAWVEDPALKSEFQKMQCKKQAEYLIAQVDYVVLPDRSVMVKNLQEVIDYRTVLFGLIQNPVENPAFPPKPEVIYK